MCLLVYVCRHACTCVKLCVCMWRVYYACLLVYIQACVCVYTHMCELCVCGVGVCGVCMHMHACTRVCARAFRYAGACECVPVCGVCTSMCVRTCAYPQGDHRSLACMWECICASCQSIALLTPLRFLGCKGFPGACMTGLCTRCQPHPNMQLPLLLSNPRLPNTSLHPSETSTSPTSAYQVRNYSSQGSPPCSGSQRHELLRNGPTASDTRGTKDGSGGIPASLPPGVVQKAEGVHGGSIEIHDPGL